MPESKPRLARLTAILTQLQSKRILTAREIAEKHEVSIRTVYRDIRSLEQSGIPIYTREGKGYSIMEGYKLPPVMFTEEEAHALITAEQIIQRNRDSSLSQQYSNAIEKIKSILQYEQKDSADILAKRLQIRLNYENKKTSDHLIMLQLAITRYQLMDLSYLSLKNEESQRKIEPFALIHTQENCVLIAYCQLRQDFRAFRLDRIQKLHALNQNFEAHELSLQTYFEKLTKSFDDP